MSPLTPRILLELLNLHNAFHQGQYATVLKESTSGLSPESVVPAKVYVLRARIASGEAAEVIAETGSATEPDFQAVNAFAEYNTGNTGPAVATIEGLISSAADNGTVQVLGGTILHLEGRSDEALSLLSKHEGSLEACVFCGLPVSIFFLYFLLIYSSIPRSVLPTFLRCFSIADCLL